jgi:hypothetical protein
MSKSNLADAQRAVLSLTPEELQAFTLWFVNGRPAPAASPRPRDAQTGETRATPPTRMVPRLPEGWEGWPREKLEDLEENLQALARDELSPTDRQELTAQLRLVARAIVH